jgi:hypothetical protein
MKAWPWRCFRRRGRVGLGLVVALAWFAGRAADPVPASAPAPAPAAAAATNAVALIVVDPETEAVVRGAVRYPGLEAAAQRVVGLDRFRAAASGGDDGVHA